MAATASTQRSDNEDLSLNSMVTTKIESRSFNIVFSNKENDVKDVVTNFERREALIYMDTSQSNELPISKVVIKRRGTLVNEDLGNDNSSSDSDSSITQDSFPNQSPFKI